MSELNERLRRYADARAGHISDGDADSLITRALAKPARRPGWTRHGLNAGLALGIAILLIVGGVVLKLQLRGQTAQGPGPTPRPPAAVPHEIVNLDDPSQDPSLESPFDLKTGKVLTPVQRWVLPQSRALIVYSTTGCVSSTIRVVDRLTGSDTQPEVTLPDCYDTPILLPGTAVLLSHSRVISVQQHQVEDLGEVLYDWSTARVVKSYAPPSAGFTGGLVSPDGTRLYTLNPYVDSPALDIMDLVSGTHVAHVPVDLMQVGLNPGGLGLSTDGRTLFANLGDQLATFDARTGGVGPALPFKDLKPGSTSALPAWLVSIDADAKEGFEPNHGIAIDPKGRWVVALGADDRTTEGIWIFSASGSLHLVRHVGGGAGFRGIAFSLDGSVVYALDASSNLDVFDPQTGRQIKHYKTTGNFLGIGGVEPR